tara:strand:+ start:496 stop:1272 length:777 start_codon:yes stop_codon:yes gene_type:complete
VVDSIQNTGDLQKWYNSIGGTHEERCQVLTELIQQSESTVREQWVRMGWALRTIRDDSLYVGEFESFADFVEKKLGYKKSWAYEVIDASEVAKVVPIKAVSQARVLAQLEPEEQQAVWDRAVQISDGEVTAKAIKQAASGSDESKQESIPDPLPEYQEPPSFNEDEDRVKLERLINDLRTELKNISSVAEKGVLQQDGGHWFDFDQFKSSLQNAARVLRMAAPAADCPYCNGAGCEVCAHLGWLPKGVYDALPSDMKE